MVNKCLLPTCPSLRYHEIGKWASTQLKDVSAWLQNLGEAPPSIYLSSSFGLQVDTPSDITGTTCCRRS
jgi:hypothetical protein